MKDKKIVNYLFGTGISSRNKGFNYLYDAIDMVIKNNCILPSLVYELYPEIGKKYNENWKNVERCMRNSIRTSIKPDVRYMKLGDYISKAAIHISMD